MRAVPYHRCRRTFPPRSVCPRSSAWRRTGARSGPAVGSAHPGKGTATLARSPGRASSDHHQCSSNRRLLSAAQRRLRPRPNLAVMPGQLGVLRLDRVLLLVVGRRAAFSCPAASFKLPSRSRRHTIIWRMPLPMEVRVRLGVTVCKSDMISCALSVRRNRMALATVRGCVQVRRLAAQDRERKPLAGQATIFCSGEHWQSKTAPRMPAGMVLSW